MWQPRQLMICMTNSPPPTFRFPSGSFGNRHEISNSSQFSVSPREGSSSSSSSLMTEPIDSRLFSTFIDCPHLTTNWIHHARETQDSFSTTSDFLHSSESFDSEQDVKFSNFVGLSSSVSTACLSSSPVASDPATVRLLKTSTSGIANNFWETNI